MTRETFASKFGLLATMIGVAVGLGNVWRFPYLVGKFGGAAFVICYVAAVVLIGMPALVAEWLLGRHTRRGTVGAFARAGLPGGRGIGWFFFAVVAAATAYYSNALGWVLHYSLGELVRPFGVAWDSAAVLPPESGFDAGSLVRQLLCTGTVIVTCALVLARGLRQGIERASRVIMPTLAVALVIVMIRSLTLPGAMAGVEWYLLKVDWSSLSPRVMMAALGQAVFSLSLGGTFMVIYGSYLDEKTQLVPNALWTALGDLGAGLLAGLAILPAVFAFGLEPGSGPGLLFSTLPSAFAAMPAGWLFGAVFFLALFGAAYLSDVGAFEVLVAGLVDSRGWSRRRAVWLVAGVVFLLAIPSMINLEIFVPWDLTFGSGMQTLGALAAVVTVGWWLARRDVLSELGAEGRGGIWLYRWLRYVVPLAIGGVGAWWLTTEVIK